MNKQHNAENVLSQIHEGMAVYDAENHKIGTVSDMYFGAAVDEQQDYGSGPATAPERGASADEAGRTVGVPLPTIPLATGLTGSGTGTGMVGVLPVFAFEDDVPQGLRSRLLEQGFVQVKGAGILSSARYIMPGQIASVQNEEVHLNIRRDRLIKGE
ncbi:MAG: hypothetical protein ACYDBJ_16945 [Aggregatilineales bacterium]